MNGTIFLKTFDVVAIDNARHLEKFRSQIGDRSRLFSLVMLGHAWFADSTDSNELKINSATSQRYA